MRTVRQGERLVGGRLGLRHTSGLTGQARQLVLLLAALSTVLMNVLSTAWPLFGATNKQVSDALPNAFTPAGVTFSVWGVIFLGLLAFAVYQALPGQRGPRLDRVFWPFLLANLLNSTWLCAFQSRNIGVSVGVISLLLLSLIWLYVTLDRLPMRAAERLLLGVPTSLYLAWISVASMANVTAWLVNRGLLDGLGGLSAPFWAALLALLAGGLGAALLIVRRDLAFGLVLAWALYGVYLARPQQQTVTSGVLLAAAVLLLGLLLGVTRRARHPLLAH